MSRLWDKGGKTNALALAFTVGDDYAIDQRLIAFDIAGSIAHVTALAASGFITNSELNKLMAAYATVEREAESGKLVVTPEQEDCHTAIEQRLTALLGPLGAKIHTGRSRNDQVVTMLRLAMRERALDTVKHLAGLVNALLGLARRYPDQPMPGYTHMQRAMPSSVAAWALGYAEVLCERAEALLGWRKHASRSALGSAAGYGVPLKLDRKAAASAMGFEHVQAVTAVQLTRGLDELALTQHLALVGIVVSRMAADLVLFATREYGFAKLPAELTTGSSIMPNKSNPDLFELMRARGAGLSAHPAAIAPVLAGLPGGYQRDLQIIKKSLVSALDECGMLLEAAALGVSGVVFDAEACKRAMAPELYATAYAYRLVREEKVPFREAYKKAAAEPTNWKPGFFEKGADSADSPDYTKRLAASIAKRVAALDAEEPVSKRR